MSRSWAPVAIGVLLLAGCAGGGSVDREVERDGSLESFDPDTTVVVRAPFCDEVTDEAVAAALDTDGDALGAGAGEEVDRDTWGTESREESEIGCRWSTGDAAATAFVHTDAVDRDQARLLVRQATRAPCEVLPDTPPFGAPGLATVCRLDSDTLTTGFQGLFGDAWLSCSITGTGDRQRVADWCVAVLTAAT